MRIQEKIETGIKRHRRRERETEEEVGRDTEGPETRRDRAIQSSGDR